MKQYDKGAVKQYRQVWLWLVLWVAFLPVTQAATDCNTVTEIPVSECQSLLELYNSTNGAYWKNNTGWNQTNTPCSWFGVTCSVGHVTKIQFTRICISDLSNISSDFSGIDACGNGLIGQIPNLNLPNLTALWLSDNQLSGNIPHFSNLPKLTELWLDHNQLSGTIPNFTAFSLANLEYALFNNNCGLIAYDAAQESVLNSKDPDWQVRNPNCPILDFQPDIRIEPTTLTFP
jgi:hypothetical protein